MPDTSSILTSPVLLGRSMVLTLAVLALGVFALSGWGESRYQGGPDQERALVQYLVKGEVEMKSAESATLWEPLHSDVSLQSGMLFRTNENAELGILFSNGDLIRLFSDSELKFTRLALTGGPALAQASLVKGAAWVSDLQGTLDLELRTDHLVVAPEWGAAYVATSPEQDEVFAAHHSTRVSFFDPAVPEKMLNTYLLTESHQIKVPPLTQPDVLTQLRYTKLTKEYPFVYLAESEWERRWIIALESDLDRLNVQYTQFLSELRRTGDSGSDQDSVSYRLEGVFRTIRSWLTFDRHNLAAVESNEQLSLLNQALYLTLQGDDAAEERLNRFKQSYAASVDLIELAPVIRMARAVQWGSVFYPIKQALRDLELRAKGVERAELPLIFLRERLYEIYDLLDRGELGDAKGALLDYEAEWERFMQASGTMLTQWIGLLTEERQILHNLIYREPSFYSLEFYQLLTLFEKKILNLTALDFDLNEERQAFVQDKIRFLSRLVTLIDEGVVGVKTGNALAQHLLSDSQTLIREVSAETAVTDYFVRRLNELSLQFEFIASPDFSLGQGSFDERFRNYLAKESAFDELSVYVSGLRGAEAMVSSGVALEAAIAETEQAFRSARISFAALVPLGDSEARLFTIQGGRVGTIAFEGKYDRVTGLVYDLRVENDVFSVGIKLHNLSAVVQRALSSSVEKEVEAPVSSEPVALFSPVQKLAIELVLNRFHSFEDFEFVEMEHVTIYDLNKNEFALVFPWNDLEEAMVQVSLNYDLDDDKTSEIQLRVGERVLTVDSTELSGLAEALKAAWDQYRIEQTQEVTDEIDGLDAS